MKRYTKNLVAALLILVILFSTYGPVVAKDNNYPTTYSKTSNSGQQDEICITLNGTSASTYYTGANTYENWINNAPTSSSTNYVNTSLLGTLRSFMTSTHKTITSYGDCKDYSDNTDCENNDGRVLLLYTSCSATMNDWISGSKGWNREHVWPQSLGGFSTSRAGSDLHHIRPDDQKTNSTRGNNKFGEVTGGTKVVGSSTVTGYAAGYVGGGYYEPNDNVKGDVARICLYVYARWGGEYSESNNILNVFQSIDVLLEWCALDPVDTWEMGRNEVVQKIQGNRNVFIDYPELAWYLFGRQNQLDDNKYTPSVGEWTGNKCEHNNTVINNKTDATCGKAGYTGDKFCNDCNKTIEAGKTISATGNHSFSAWEINEEQGNKTRTCTVCQKKETASITAEECTHSKTELVNVRVADCKNDGYTGDERCVGCKQIMKYGQQIPSTGDHGYSEMIIVTAPTIDQNGVGKHVCEGCGDSYEVEIPAFMLDPDAEPVAILLQMADTEAEKIMILLSLGAGNLLFVNELSK